MKVYYQTLKSFLAAKTLVSPFKPNYWVCPVKSYIIETVRKYFVSTRCQKSPCGEMAELPECLDAQLTQLLDLFTRSSFTFIRILSLRGFCSIAYLLDGLDMANSDASSAAARGLVSFYIVATDDTSSLAPEPRRSPQREIQCSVKRRWTQRPVKLHDALTL